MKAKATYVTGSRRGYIPVYERGVESCFIPIPSSLKGYAGNLRRALEKFIAAGCTHFTVCHYQGVPFRGYSTRYCYSVYYGYVEENT